MKGGGHVSFLKPYGCLCSTCAGRPITIKVSKESESDALYN